jgi:hypothetical protein
MWGSTQAPENAHQPEQGRCTLRVHYKKFKETAIETVITWALAHWVFRNNALQVHKGEWTVDRSTGGKLRAGSQDFGMVDLLKDCAVVLRCTFLGILSIRSPNYRLPLLFQREFEKANGAWLTGSL